VNRLSQRINKVQPSPTLAISAKAKALIAKGVDIIGFAAGEPDFDTPTPIREAAIDALNTGKTRYTPANGIPELRQAIAEDYRRRGREISPDEVLVSVGAKHALYNATQALFEQGDVVIIPAPYWVSYPAQVLLAGAEPKIVSCRAEDNFKLGPQELAKALDAPGVRSLILCSPSNPTGAVYSTEELAGLGEVLEDYPEVIVFFDAIYDRICYARDIAPDPVATVPRLAERTLTFNGFSKTYAMTGWRLGYTIGPRDIISAMSKLQSQSTSNPTSFAQYGALEALRLSDEAVGSMRDTFRRRRDLMVDGLRSIEKVACARPGGAFYVFPDFSAYCGPDGHFADDLALAEYLLEEARVAVVPGTAFGASGHLRLSYATADEKIVDGLGRINKALQRFVQ
jgi:aspartate aminotransferase